MTWPWAGWPKVFNSIPGMCKRVFSSPKFPVLLWFPPSFVLSEHRVLFPPGCSSWEWSLLLISKRCSSEECVERYLCASLCFNGLYSEFSCIVFCNTWHKTCDYLSGVCLFLGIWITSNGYKIYICNDFEPQPPRDIFYIVFAWR